ncbi:glycosyl hydrolase 115 family protein, partial [Massilia horti]
MTKTFFGRLIGFLFCLASTTTLANDSPIASSSAQSAVGRQSSADWVRTERHPGDFVLADASGTATIVFSDEDAKVVRIAARDLAADIEKVTGRRPRVAGKAASTAVIIGTLGRSALIDKLAGSGKLSVAQLRGAWESFVIATVEQPMPGVQRALVIAGSDPRGTAFGTYELSQAIGVSPWNWWADVTPERKAALYLASGLRRFGPPSVKYRGIFINDEDWGLHRWASKTFEPEFGGIGPKTYEKVFELLLRLKANSLWPGMHPPTKAFNADPRNAALANDYAIVMGSSHAEPMLRNNGKEWTEPPDHFNYATHPAKVLQYWRDRIETNKQYENMYTIGMRGINDARMQGPKEDRERIKLLEQIFADQRELLPKGAQQVFTPYKEVLPLYNQGLKVPEDVTIIWPDDNFGYIRRYANEAERQRSGGMGVYYHISYSGAPMSYLWLHTTPPALVWEEMSKAYDHGARTVWIVNVGDIKPAEAGAEFFLQMAWDINRWKRENLPDYLPQWAAREFGKAHAGEIASIMDKYFRLNFDRKPEHLQWWLPKTTPHPSTLSFEESRQRVREFKELQARVEHLQSSIAQAKRDAYFELVAYPVVAAALANERYFEAELGNMERAKAANAELVALTAKWDT